MILINLDFIKNCYNSDSNRINYGEAIDKSGLWKSEQIIFEKYVRKSDKILDLGCGAGRTTINLFKLGYTNIIGLDLSNSLIDYAKNYTRKNNLNIEFILGDARKLYFDDNSFDVVLFSFNGLMCIPEQKNRDVVLAEIHRVLKRGGKFIFTAHNRDDSGEYNAFWDEEKLRWENGTNDKNLFQFGDRLIAEEGCQFTFVHIASTDELIKFIEQENFEILERVKRSDIADENELVKEFSTETVFWIVQK